MRGRAVELSSSCSAAGGRDRDREAQVAAAFRWGAARSPCDRSRGRTRATWAIARRSLPLRARHHPMGVLLNGIRSGTFLQPAAALLHYDPGDAVESHAHPIRPGIGARLQHHLSGTSATGAPAAVVITRMLCRRADPGERRHQRVGGTLDLPSGLQLAGIAPGHGQRKRRRWHPVWSSRLLALPEPARSR